MSINLLSNFYSLGCQVLVTKAGACNPCVNATNLSGSSSLVTIASFPFTILPNNQYELSINYKCSAFVRYLMIIDHILTNFKDDNGNINLVSASSPGSVTFQKIPAICTQQPYTYNFLFTPLPGAKLTDVQLILQVSRSALPLSIGKISLRMVSANYLNNFYVATNPSSSAITVPLNPAIVFFTLQGVAVPKGNQISLGAWSSTMLIQTGITAYKPFPPTIKIPVTYR